MKSELEERLAALSHEKRALFMLRLRQPRSAAASAEDRIARRPDGSSHVLSHAERRLWFLQRQQPANPAYTFMHGLSARIRGRLNVPALERAIAEVFRRHEVLRATFADVQGEPRLHVEPELHVELGRVDLSDLPSADEREAAVGRLFAREGRTPFDLSRGPLARMSLLRLEEDHHVLMSAVHHIVADGFSTGVFLKELVGLYDAFAAGRPSPLEELEIQYADYAHWQVTRLSEGALGAQLSYWSAALAGAPPFLELPADRTHPPVRSHQGDALTIRMPRELAAALDAFARRENASVFMVLLSAFGALIHRYVHAPDFVLGILDANRNRRELEGLIGMFSNTLCVRMNASGDPPFRTFFHRVREVALSAISHADVPFDVVVEALHPARSQRFTPVVQVLVSLRALPTTSWSSETLTFELVDYPATTAKFDLSVEMFPHPAGIDVTFIYNTDVFEPATIQRMMSGLRRMLESVAQDPDRPLSQLSLLDEAERRTLIDEWNSTVAPPPHARVHQLFEAIARELPGEVAVRFQDQELTYRELDSRANQLACYLQRRGVGADVPVALHVERSIEMIVGLLGILKAGGVFMPVESSLPPERVAFMLKDAGVRHVLTQDRLRPALPEEHASAIRLDADWEEIRRARDEPPECAVDPDHLAYIIYTSGSTGEPKGTLITHQGLANRLLWDQTVLRLGKGDRVMQKTPIGFDGAFKETLLPLISGARVVLAEPGGHRDPRYLARLIAEEGITFAFFVPSLLRMFLQQEDLEACNRTLRVIWCGGEALPLDLKRECDARLSATLYNGYGPTEASIGVLYHRCTPEDDRPIIPIGRPISNARIYMLDAHKNPVPPLVSGELCIGGMPLGRGYLNRPAQTAERFVPDPFSDEGGRMYRTGDLARYLPDGTIEFLGRMDRQVKIRGNRVELEEIERALLREPGVAQAVVAARAGDAGNAGDQRLVAYVVSSSGGGLQGGDLRSALERRLPDYMVPSAFVTLDALPLTATGKIDRNALPAVVSEGEGEGEREGADHAPRSELEATLADLWEQVLGVRVGVKDNFFDAGGHSLLLMRLQSLIESSLGREVPVATLFEHPTISAQAAHLGGAATPAGVVEGEQGLAARSQARARRQREALERQQDAAGARGRALRNDG